MPSCPLQIQSSLSIHWVKARKESEADNNCGCEASVLAGSEEKVNAGLIPSVGIRFQSCSRLEIWAEYLCVYLQLDIKKIELALE